MKIDIAVDGLSARTSRRTFMRTFIQASKLFLVSVFNHGSGRFGRNMLMSSEILYRSRKHLHEPSKSASVASGRTVYAAHR